MSNNNKKWGPLDMLSHVYSNIPGTVNTTELFGDYVDPRFESTFDIIRKSTLKNLNINSLDGTMYGIVLDPNADRSVPDEPNNNSSTSFMDMVKRSLGMVDTAATLRAKVMGLPMDGRPAATDHLPKPRSYGASPADRALIKMYPTFVYSPQEYPLIPGSWVRCRFSAGTYQSGIITELDITKPAFSLMGDPTAPLAEPSAWGNPFSLSQIRPPTIAGSYPGDYVSEGQPYVLPIMGATTLTVGSSFKFRINPVTKEPETHKALDIGAAAGTPLVALADGEVVYTRNGTLSPEAGYYIIIKYEDKINGGDLYSRYLHMVGPSPKSRGDKVEQGEIVGGVGNTGRSTGAHLHFELGKVYPGAVGGTLGQLFDPVAYWPEGSYVTTEGTALIFETIPGAGSA